MFSHPATRRLSVLTLPQASHTLEAARGSMLPHAATGRHGNSMVTATLLRSYAIFAPGWRLESGGEKVDEVLKQWAHVLGLDTGVEFRV
jgi:hypothetical protein